MPTDAKVAPKSCLGAFEVLSFFPLIPFLQNGKNGHGALAGLTWVKGTSVDKVFESFFKKLQNMVSGTCRSYVSKRYKCPEEGCEKGQKREGTIADFLEPLLIENALKTI